MKNLEGVNRDRFIKPDPNQRDFLLNAAYSALNAFLHSGEFSLTTTADPVLNQTAGVFVTLMQIVPDPKDVERQILQLRGCIGNIESDQPLCKLVPVMAIKAATEDPRFAAVTVAEGQDILVEISILSPLRQIKALDEIEVGVDGLLLSGNGRRGLLLPKVPKRFGWNHAQFLQNLCYKAGLPPDFWPKFGKLEAFTTVNIADAALIKFQKK